MTAIPFVTLDDPRYGEAVQVAPRIRRIVARNPSKYTYHGTGTYVVGRGEVAVIDPGPDLPTHRAALEQALVSEQVVAIVVTHCHSDHSPLAAWLSAATGAPTVAVGPHVAHHDWVEDDTPDSVAEEQPHPDADPDSATEEALDLDFVPDVRVAAGDVAAEGEGYRLIAVPTPGHTSNHLALWMPTDRAMFTGDHIMGWSTTVIGPPDGDMRAYMASLATVRDFRPATLWPTHGAPVTDVEPFIDAYVAHRVSREAGVLAAVRDGVALVPDMVHRLYVGVNERLYKAAGRSVLAHLLKLADDGLVRYDGEHPGVTVPWSAI